MESILAGKYTIYVIILAIIISYFFVFLFAIQNRKLKKRYYRLFNGIDVQQLEEIIVSLHDENVNIRQQLANQMQNVDQLNEKMKHMKSNVYIHRYSAFSDEHAGLSYSVVFLDEHQNGLVITGLYNREQSYTYAKPIVKGESSYRLSPEEEVAIQKTLTQVMN
jgi:hypothetical protein